MSLNTHSMPGYTVIPKAADQIAAMDQDIPTSFEVHDISTGNRETIFVAAPKKKGRPPKKAIPPASLDRVVRLATDGGIPLSKEEVEESPVVAEVEETPELEDVVFVTPYTDITVGVIESYRDDTVFSIVTPADDRVKVRPKRSATLDVVYRGETIPLYASGLYIPLESMGAIVSIFFVVNEGGE